MDKKIVMWAAYCLDALLFFMIIFSGLPDLLKVALCIATLSLGGLYMARLSGWESFLGINMVRGKYGFSWIDSWGRKHPNFLRLAADAGAGVGYGIVYSLIVFRNQKKKLAAIILSNMVIYLMLALMSMAISSLYSGSPQGDVSSALSSPQFLILLGSGILGGVALQTLVSLSIQAFAILTVPKAPPGAMLVIPGVTVPWEWLFGILIAMVVHEFAHGVLCRAEKLAISSSGIILFGFLPIGAFVEPDEEKFKKLKLGQKRSILAAGPTANIVAFCVFIPLAIAAIFAQHSVVVGLAVVSINASNPGVNSLALNDVILRADGTEITGTASLQAVLSAKKPGEPVMLETDRGNKVVSLSQDRKLGIAVVPSARPGMAAWFAFLSFLSVVLLSTAYINFAIASVNLLPLFITDGARLLYEEMRERYGGEEYSLELKKSRAKRISLGVSLVVLGVIFVNLVLPPVFRLVFS